MFRLLVTFFLFAHVIAKGGGVSRGGRSSGYGGGGTSKKMTVRGSVSNQDTGYRSNVYIIYSVLMINRYQRNSFMYSRDPEKLNLQEQFDCGNGKKIPEDLVCDWADDCGNGMDERVPLPCQGKYSPQELYLYLTMLFLYFIFLLLVYIYFKIVKQKQDQDIDFFLDRKALIASRSVMLGIMMFITLVFLLVAVDQEKSIIIEYYITTCVIVCLGILYSLCLSDCYAAALWFSVFLVTIITMYHGSVKFSYIPNYLLKREYYSNIYTDSSYLIQTNQTNTTQDIYQVNNIANTTGFWKVNRKFPSQLYIDFNKTVNLAVLDIYPTFPEKTTHVFKIYYNPNINKSIGNWTQLVSGPMPNVTEKTSLQIILSDRGIPTRHLKFIGFPIEGCNQSNSSCVVGLDELRVWSLPYR